MKDPRCVRRYTNTLDELCKKEALYQRMNSLHQIAIDPLTTAQQIEYEDIDKLLCINMEKAEKTCRKLHMGTTKWSPTYKKVMLTLEYWKMRKSYFLGLHSNVRQLIVLQNKLELDYDKNLTLNQIVQNIKQTYKLRLKIKRMAISLNLEYRTRLAEAKEEAGEIKAAVYIRNLNRIEEVRKIFQNIRVMEKKLKGGSTSKVVITSDDGTKIEYSDKKSVERVIATSNEKQWHATEGGSQLHTPTFIAKLGTYGEGGDINKVMDGSFTYPPDTSIDTKDFLEACKRIDVKEDTPVELNTRSRYQTFIQSWKRRRESTCTYGQHVGHYQAASRHKNLGWLFFQRGDIPTISSYAPIRHKKCIDLMILKKSQTFELSSQRILGILDTEFNHNNGFVGRDITAKSISKNALADEQFSQPGRSALQEIIVKRCTIDHQQSQRQSFAITSCDLAGCYDRIIHTAAALAMLRIGVSHKRIKSMFQTIQK